ncbi:hypothetical protein SAZ_23820 [Streptomyces noursei ZPM]|uniref:PknH-like extracellular domain-containing protein n=1 Tax=Streptomyces noursei TaxID=1971 RepID=A0A401R4K9_STRNR|nr:hypothetical protein [Streptomyces noursei]AKA05133.1 hypothetical protein SAZ_23820 [Streptomyces noursei ZPM]EOT03930.1 hypothetical protein K530_11123 [Streptomyces noursei CCRC 11814]EXU91539.1 hypothetical protein P354_01175 [Streptomyces noursei PD-1]UWS73528.1 hypothetical protein N1H47_21125 [Streptomyces noursei]GCB92575.1 hypothetical protein SALB_05342 [Streptomyces noursei]
MRLHTTTVVSLSALAVLFLAGCSTGSTSAADSTSSPSASVRQEGNNASAPAPLSSAALSKRLLDESDLGEGYTRKPEQPKRHDDVAVTGCPALDRLGGDAAAGGSLDFPRKAKASFTYAGGSDSAVAEELYSDTEDKLSKGVGRIFDAMVSCSMYQVLVGGTPIEVTAAKAAVTRIGDERWGQVLTFAVGGRSTVMKQAAVRTGKVLVVVSGSSALVDAHVEKAVAKARVTH